MRGSRLLQLGHFRAEQGFPESTAFHPHLSLTACSPIYLLAPVTPPGVQPVLSAPAPALAQLLKLGPSSSPGPQAQNSPPFRLLEPRLSGPLLGAELHQSERGSVHSPGLALCSPERGPWAAVLQKAGSARVRHGHGGESHRPKLRERSLCIGVHAA